jgi:hypothetical protein
MDVLQWVPLLGALGIGSVIGNWFGAGYARREVRSGVLKAIAATEKTRWAAAHHYPDFRDAARDLQTSALIARIPREAVRHYLVFAEAARRLSDDSFDDPDRDGDVEMGAGGSTGTSPNLSRMPPRSSPGWPGVRGLRG